MRRAWQRAGIAMVAVPLGMILGAGDAAAFVSDRSWEVGVYVFNAALDNDSLIEDVPGFGLRGAYYVKAQHAIQVEIDSGTGDHRNPEDDPALEDVEFDVLKYSVAYMHSHFIKGHEKVVVESTYGVGRINVDRDDLGDDTATFFLIGAGFKYRTTPNSGFKFKAQIYEWRGDGQVTPRDGFFSFDVTFGWSWFFGGTE
ncbi:MAG: hypothetical protein ACE5JH_11850 [Acidobacteriota bacterium]